MKKKRKTGGLFFGVVLAGVAVAGYGAGPGGWFEGEDVEALEGVEVRRGPLLISEVVHGNLKAKDSITLKNEIEGDTTILFLEEEGTLVEAGDLICELDVSELTDDKVTQEIAVKNAEADYTKAKEQYEIQVIQNETDIAEARLALMLAGKDLQKWQDEGGELEHEQQKLEETIKLKQEELARATREFDFTSDLFEKGFAQANELKEHELSKQRAEIELEQAQREKDLQYKYGYERRLAELEAARDTATRDVRKVEKQAIARLADFEAARESADYELVREREKLAKLTGQIGKAKILAPASGMLVYGRERNHRWGQGEAMDEGVQVRERQTIAEIPRAGGMVADASLHETQLKKVKVGQPCRVTIDALAGQVFEGRVGFVAVLPDAGSWFSNPNQRLYRSEVTLDKGVGEMRPGMTCSIEVMIDDLEDVLYIPRQCVFLDGQETVCFVKDGGGVETRPVTVGLDNSKWVEIREGLEEGEIVMLTPPANFDPSPVELSDRPESAHEFGGGGGEGGPPSDHGGSSGSDGGRGDRSNGSERERDDSRSDSRGSNERRDRDREGSGPSEERRGPRGSGERAEEQPSQERERAGKQ